MRCHAELCSNWSGDGEVCTCALFDLDPPVDVETEDGWLDRALNRIVED